MATWWPTTPTAARSCGGPSPFPAPGEPGSETWTGDDWKTGGGSAWMTGNYDQGHQDHLLGYWQCCAVARAMLTPATTSTRPRCSPRSRHRQDQEHISSTIQNNSWDWDEVDAPILVDLQRDGRTIKSLIHPGRNAIFWVLERKPDKISYVAGWPYVYTDVWKGIDPETGKPIVDPAHKPVIGKRVEFCPSLWGGKDWPSAAYSQKTEIGLRSGQREHLRRLLWREGAAGSRPALARHQARGHRPDAPSRRRTLRRTAGVGSGNRQESLVAQLPEVAIVRFGDWRPRAISSLSAAPTIASSAPSTPRPANYCGSRRPTPASWACRSPMRSTARNILRSSPAGASTRSASRMRWRPRNRGLENNVPQGGVVWVFAVKK